jgi:Mycothiol maleylpyruvate isomerase N-terminal domain
MAPSDPTWNFQDPASKERVLNVLEGEMDAMFQLIDDPARWEAPTACEKWQARDVVGHLVDTTEGYLPAFAGARDNAAADEPLGLRDMAELVDQGARGLREVPREELIGRLRASDGVQFSPGDIDDCDAVLEFDPATLVLTGYARMNGGTARGDEELASKFRDLFFPI